MGIGEDRVAGSLRPSHGRMGGVSFFAWAGEGRPAPPAEGGLLGWHEGDPFVGDPPSERQGRFSVFDSDSSTCGLLQDYAAKLNTPWVQLD